MFRVTYDQFLETEYFNVFNTMEEVIEFAMNVLHGTYTRDMTRSQLVTELEANGYFLN